MSFWRNTDAKDNIWVDLRPLEGWGTSDWGDRNYFITREVHCFVKMLQYLLKFLTFLLFSRTKKATNRQTNKTNPQSQVLYPSGKSIIKLVLSNSLSRRKENEMNLQFISNFSIRFRTGCYTNEWNNLRCAKPVLQRPSQEEEARICFLL